MEHSPAAALGDVYGKARGSTPSAPRSRNRDAKPAFVSSVAKAVPTTTPADTSIGTRRRVCLEARDGGDGEAHEIVGAGETVCGRVRARRKLLDGQLAIDMRRLVNEGGTKGDGTSRWIGGEDQGRVGSAERGRQLERRARLTGHRAREQSRGGVRIGRPLARSRGKHAPRHRVEASQGLERAGGSERVADLRFEWVDDDLARARLTERPSRWRGTRTASLKGVAVACAPTRSTLGLPASTRAACAARASPLPSRSGAVR